MQALSPARQEELLKVLSASQSPVRGTYPPTNTPCSTSDHSCGPSPLSRVRDERNHRAWIDGSTPQDGAGNGAWARLIQKREQRPQLLSEVNIGNHSTREKDGAMRRTIPILPRRREDKEETNKRPSVKVRSVSHADNRQRSGSIGSKRKRGSLSPGRNKGTPREAVQVLIESSSPSSSPAPPSGRGGMGRKRGTRANGGASLAAS